MDETGNFPGRENRTGIFLRFGDLHIFHLSIYWEVCLSDLGPIYWIIWNNLYVFKLKDPDKFFELKKADWSANRYPFC